MRILALDVATSTGWAFWSDDPPSLRFGEQRFEGEIGQFANDFSHWLTCLLAREAPDRVYVEAPLTVRKGRTNLSTTMRLIGAQVIVHELCYAFAIPATSVSVSSWRKAFIGRAVAPRYIPKTKRRKWLKDAVVEECHRRGVNVRSDNEGDAIGLLNYALEVERGVGIGSSVMRMAA